MAVENKAHAVPKCPLLPTELSRHRKVPEVTDLCDPNSDADILAPQAMVSGGGPLGVPVVRPPG